MSLAMQGLAAGMYSTWLLRFLLAALDELGGGLSCIVSSYLLQQARSVFSLQINKAINYYDRILVPTMESH